MDFLWLLFGGSVCIILHFLHTFSSAEKPTLHYKDGASPFIRNVLEMCPIFSSLYQPTSFWGKSGHFQTVIHVKMGRVKPKWPDSQRFHLAMPDNATMSYDVFEPHKEGVKAEFTLALCPGIANTSECIYMRSFAELAQSHGYRVAILNHLGALKSEVLTAPRIFTYGGTEEYGQMIDDIMEKYNSTKIIAVGFSMGGNIVSKYLGERMEHQRKVLCGVSVCQGYDINEAKELFMKWSNMIRMYNFLMTLKQRSLISQHRQLLFSKEAEMLYGTLFNESGVFRATSLFHIDENYSSTRAGFKSTYDYYRYSSSSYYLANIKIPMLFLNSLDDPVCPKELLKHPREFVEKNPHSIFMTTKHGGHLGFFEGGYMIPDNITWLDRVIIEYADAVTNLYLHDKLPTRIDVMKEVEETSQEYDSAEIETGLRSERDVLLEVTRKRRSGTLDQSFCNSTCHGEQKDQEKRGSLKRGLILQQATSYMQ